MSNSVSLSANLFILDGSKALMGRRTNTTWMDGMLCPFGGHVDAGETPRQALVREIQEELGVTVDESDIEFLAIAARNSDRGDYAAYQFVLRKADYDFKNLEPDYCSELVWVDIDALSDDVIPLFAEVIRDCLVGGKKYLEIGY